MSVKRTLLIIISFLVAVSFVPQPTCAAGKKTKNNVDLSGLVIFKTAYDDNIFQYSDSEKNDFENGIDPERYPIETTDDLIFTTVFDLDYKTRLKGHTTLLSARFTQYQYWQNKDKDYESFSFSAIQYFSPKTTIRFNYYFLPEKYFRHYYDEDLSATLTASAFVPFAYKEHQFSLGLSHSFKKIDLKLYTKYGFELYEENFREYDSDFFTAGLSGDLKLTRKIGLFADVSYIKCNSKGYDQVGERASTSDDRDYSHEQNNYLAGIRFQLPKIAKKSNQVSFSGEFRKRVFTTDKTSDNYHYQREDDDLQLEAEYTLQINKSWSLELSTQFTQRDVDVPLQQEIQEVKDFTRKRVEISVTYGWN